MDNFVDARDYELLDGDRYSFSILRMIMGKSSRLLLTDHERLILCKAEVFFPAWLWTPDDASAEEMEHSYALAAENGLVREGQNLYMKYDLADYWIKRAAKDGLKITISSNTFAYDCPEPKQSADSADGCMQVCTEADVNELAELLDMFHKETRLTEKDMEACRAEASSLIKAGNTYFWKNAQGQTVACCSYGIDGDLATISNVFTRPQYRRRHYAENLVYQVTAIAKNAGFMPMLYADADYAASNGCYVKIGYILRGKLCVVDVSR